MTFKGNEPHEEGFHKGHQGELNHQVGGESASPATGVQVTQEKGVKGAKSGKAD